MTLLAAGSSSAGSPWDGDPRDEAPLDRVLRALGHPVRRRILRSLVDRDGSASTLSREFHMDLGVVSYHLNQVLAKECGIVELVKTLPRRGAIEKFYGLRFDALTAFSPGEKEEPRGLRVMSLEECFIVAVAAMDANAFQRLEGSAWEWFPAVVDPAGWEEIRKAREAFNERVEAAVKKSRGKTAGSLKEVVVGAAAFPAVSLNRS
ncbi:MAG: helix-turn-helix domain-containing protein [Actinomycetota bacterium]|nr:helix-turn-helix domain-containing protein [Actinomycetota bacterium]